MKTINGKTERSIVANQIVASANIVIVYLDNNYKVEHEKTDEKDEITIYDTETFEFSIETIDKFMLALREFKEDYGEAIKVSISTTPVMVNLGFVHAASIIIEVTNK